MGKIILSEFITVDGVIEAPGGEPGFKYSGWSADYFNDEYLKYKLEEIFEVGALLLGRVTYESFAAAWPESKDEHGFADRMNSVPKYVVSTTLGKLEWNNSTLIKQNVVEEIKKLKEQSDQDILVAGSGTLAQTLFQHDLIDEFRLMVHPTILGIGRRLYTDIGEKKKLKLIEARSFSSGILVMVYHPEKQQ